MAFKDRLKQARLQKGLTQVQLASLLGVSKGAVGNYESGASAAKEEVMYKIFDVLEVDPNFLFQDEYNPPNKSDMTELEEQLLQNFRDLNEEGQEKVLEYTSDMVALGRHKKHHQSGLDSQKEA